jgi:hypothetical protein
MGSVRCLRSVHFILAEALLFGNPRALVVDGEDVAREPPGMPVFDTAPLKNGG